MFNIKFSGGEAFTVSFGAPESFDAKLTETIEKPIGDYYDGPYEFTPGDEEQVVPVAELIATRDIVIHPVPNTYGRLAWNGAYLSVY